MNNKNILKHKQKSGIKLPDFCFVVLLLFGVFYAIHINSKDDTSFINSKDVISNNISISDLHFPCFLFKENSIDIVDSTMEFAELLDSVMFYSNSKNNLITMHDFLIKNPTIILELDGHCSIGEKKTNKLSLQRAEKIKKLLIDKGIEKDRLKVRGWGIKKIKVSPQRISMAKTEEDKEKLNELNRRVVFKIISWDYRPEKK